MNNKKGLSELVSYVLLVVIAVALSALVYSYLKPYVVSSDKKPVCDTDVALIVQEASCKAGDSINPGLLNLSLLNKGLFKVDAAYIRFGPEDRRVLSLINGEGDGLYFVKIGVETQGLMPGDTSLKELPLRDEKGDIILTSAGNYYTMQIEPAVFKGSNLAVCPQAMVTQRIQCT